MSETTIRACIFDAYGTLFDVHSAVKRYSGQLGEQAQAISQLWRQKQLEYTWLRSLIGDYVDFSRIVCDALDYALASYRINDGALRGRLLRAYNELDCYPEVPAVLQALKARGLPIGLLSNGTRKMLEANITATDLTSLIDDIITVEPARIYKPSPRVYELAIDRYGPPPAGISFQSSNAWDVAGAAYFGLHSIWINRAQQPAELLPGHARVELSDLTRLPEYME